MIGIEHYDTALIAALDAVRPKVQETIAHFAHQRTLGVWLEPPLTPWHELVSPVQTTMMAHPVFNQTPMRAFGPKQVILSCPPLAANAIEVAAERGSVEAVAWLYRLFAIRGSTSIRYVAELYGLKLDERVRLSNGVTLVPLDELPSSENADAVKAQFVMLPGPQNFRMERAIGAYLECDNIPETQTITGDSRSDILESTVRAFTLVDDMAPVIGTTWSDFLDPDLVLAEHGRMYGGSRIEGGLPTIGKEVDDYALRWVEQYLALPPDMRARLDIPLARLNLGRRRLSPGDQAIEAGICLEALLGDKGDRQDLSYKLRLRTARLLEKTFDPRKVIFAAVNKLYALRSRTVHGNTSRNEAEDRKVAKEGLDICARVLQTTVRMGKLVDVTELDLKDEGA
jgi:hypothetical protein